MRKTIYALACAVITLIGAVAVGPAGAAYPEKPVNFIVPWPPGDLEDILTRMIAENFQEEYGVSAAVVNRPGGGGGPFPGAISVATAPADGYTVGSFVIAVPTIGHVIGIDELAPEKFDPIGIFLTYPFVLAAAGDAPFSNMEQLARHARRNKVVLGHFGAPLPPTRATLAYAKRAGFSWGADAAFDALDCNTLASGDADVINTTLQQVLPCLDDIKILATITDERIPIISNVPTLGELDPKLNLALWNGLFVRKETPADARAKIAAVAKRTIFSPQARKVARDTGALIYWMDARQSARRIVKDRATLGAIGEILE